MSLNTMKVELPADSKERLLHLYGNETKYVKVEPGNWTLPRLLQLEEIKSFPIYKDDIWIITVPKAGTTLMQELAFLIMNDVNVEKSKTYQFFRVPYLEIESIHRSDNKLFDEYPENIPQNEETVCWFHNHSMEFARKLRRPRIIKSHLPLSLLPENILDKCKIIYVARNIKDAAVSLYYHFIKLYPSFKQDFKLFAKCFLNNELMYNPFIPHILEAWEKRNHPNMFFTTFERMKGDMREQTTKLVSFLRGPEFHFPDATIEKLLEAVDIETFRKNVFVNKNKFVQPDSSGVGFIRKGIIGDWKNHFNDDMNKEWDASIEKQLLGTDYKMQFEEN